MSKFGPLNRFGLWVARTWGNAEKSSAEVGKNYTMISLFSRVNYLKSPKFLQFLSRKLDRHTTEASAKRLSITDNSSLLYYSPSIAKYMPRTRLWEFIVPAVVIFRSETMIPKIIMGLGMFFYQPLAVSAGRLFVVRMDLIPHMEVVLIHKVGLFGFSRVELVPVRNLVKILPEHSQYDYYFKFLGGADLLFRDTQTGLEYAFEKNGVWLDENLKHSLIV
ncbi:hypothetical protein SteCoe_29937 [Stentor coeruleus]|uniref:Uncharacterized protein n=1 Tax=Stentor coeruleus TaxID=5963 RepID=A0A1R2B4Q2_9CILI|nr:hypothetical protein SteCoe_29937 [Stentor coeruleus]